MPLKRRGGKGRGLMKRSAQVSLWNGRFCRVLLFAVLCQLTMSVTNTVLPLYVVNGLHLTATQSGLLGTVFTVASCACRFGAGGLCDRLGWRRMMMLGAALVGGVLLLMGFTSALALLLVWKAVQGVGHALHSTASNTAASQVVPEARFGEGMGYYGLHSILTNAVGPTISLALMAVSAGGAGDNYRLPLLTAGAGGLAAVWLAASLREGGTGRPAPAERPPWSLRSFLEPRAAKPALLQGIQAISSGASIYMILFANHMGYGSVSVYYILTAAAALGVRFLVGRRMDTIRPVTLSCVPILLLAASYLALAWTRSEAAFLCNAVVSGLFNALLTPTYNALALKLSPAGRSGAASATYWLGFDLGMAVGQIVFGMIIDTNGGDSYGLSFLVAGLYLLVFCVGSSAALAGLPPLCRLENPAEEGAARRDVSK